MEKETATIFTELWNRGFTYRSIADKLGITLSESICLRRKLNLPSRMKTRYTKEGKILTPITEQDFSEGMNNGKFVEPKHRAYCVLLFYSAVRKMEALRTVKEQFQISRDTIFWDVLKRLKHGMTTPALPLPLDAPFMDELKEAIEDTEQGERVFPYCPRTGYNIVSRAFKYPHLFRLTRITWFFSPHPELGRPGGFSIAEVRNWTGLSLKALDYYVGLVQLKEMGIALTPKKQ
jgi:integrase